MGTTLDAINGQSGVTLWTVVAIEGYPYLLTNGDAATVIGAWEGEPGSDWAEAIEGLEVSANLNQRLHPWEPFDSSEMSATFSVVDVTGADIFGADVFNRGRTTSKLTANVTPSSTTITVRDSSSFAASGHIYVGNEAIQYTTNTTATGVFSGLTRGRYSPFTTESGGRFARTHYATPTVAGVDPEAGASTTVADGPIDWRGRWVGIWLHRVVGGVPDVKSEAHLIFAGKIADVSDSEDGRTVVSCTGLHNAIRDAVVLRNQWTARLRDGIYVPEGVRFTSSTRRIIAGVSTLGNADDLLVVTGAVAPGQIEPGFYSGDELAIKINQWLQAERTAGNIVLRISFLYSGQNPDGETRSILPMTDAGVNGFREWSINTSSRAIRDFFGWGSSGIEGSTGVPQGILYSDREPLRIAPVLTSFYNTLYIEGAAGDFADQAAMLPPAWANDPNLGATGAVRMGDLFIPCGSPSVVDGRGTIVVSFPINFRLGGSVRQDWQSLSVDDSGYVRLEQILILTGTFKRIVLAMLASSGGGNWVDYDVLPEHCGAAIPYSLLGGASGLEGDIAASPGSDDELAVVITKPSRLVDEIASSFVLRGVQFIWRQGRLALAGYRTPTPTASLTIGSDDRASPTNASDPMRAVTLESDEHLRNVIKIKHDADATTDEYGATTNIVISGSCSNYGARPIEISANNALRTDASFSEDIASLLPGVAARLSFLSQPAMTIRVPVPYTLFERALPGEVCLFSDEFARDPDTGRRGFANRPGLIVGMRVGGWGGSSGSPVGELDVRIFPGFIPGAYSPCAQVDDTAAGGGYDAGTKTLTCYAHRHSEATEPSDAARFPADSQVTIMQIDPDDPGSPQSWTDKVTGQTGDTIVLQTGLTGFSSSRKYRVYSRLYASAFTAQQSNAYQADDADGQVQDLRAAYGLTYTSTGQRSSYTSIGYDELPERMPTASYGDGVPLDTGHARALAVGINNLIGHALAMQAPEIVEEMTYSGSGTWCEVYRAPVFVGVGPAPADKVRKLYVSPTMASTSGTASLRVTLARNPPRSADPNNQSRDDIVRVAPYVDHTFTTSSGSYTTPTPVGLATNILRLGADPNGGIGWLIVEASSTAKFRGFGLKRVGAPEAP